MKNSLKFALVAVVLSAIIFACQKVPLTGRKQLILVSPQEMMTMSFTEYQKFLDTSKVVPASSQQTEMVKRVGTRIQKAVETYLTEQKQSQAIDGFKWEYNLVQDKQANAWCMPGGKVVVYTGILPITQTEEGLATVLGHEISHAIAQHGAERMSEQLLAQGLLVGGQTIIGIASKNPNQIGSLFNLAVGTGGQLGLLAHSRNQESEADHLGLIFMSIAGYNPQSTIPFWQRMAQLSAASSKPPVFLSTHPSDEKRITDLQKEMPEALAYYQKYGQGQGVQQAIQQGLDTVPVIKVSPSRQ